MQSGVMTGIFGFIGRYLIDWWLFLIDITTIIYVSLNSFLTLRKGKRKVANVIMYRKIYLTILNTSGIIGIVAFIFGALVVAQVSSLNVRTDVIGKIFNTVIIKELGPLLTTVIVIGRSASFIITEIGTMKNTQELIAFRAMGIETNHYVMMPRVIGVTFALLTLILFFNICCIGGGLAIILLFGKVSASYYLQSVLPQLSFIVIIGTILKQIISGLLLTAISCYYGFAGKGSVVEIPQHVAKGFVMSIFSCFVCNFTISYLLYL